MPQNEKKEEQEYGIVTIMHHFEDGHIEVEHQRTPIYCNRKAKPVTPEMRKAIEDRREAYLAELRARIGSCKTSKPKASPRKRAA